ncbi:MAG: YdcF family protein, partial [Gammaproteobacteria bacterium]
VLPEARLVVSGGTRRPDGVPMAAGYRLAAIDLGVDPARIVTLDASHDTADEAYAVRELLAPGARFVLVTSAVHLPRAMHHFRAVGLEPVPAPAEFRAWRGRSKRLGYWVPSPQNLAKSDAAWYEFLGSLIAHREHVED